MARKKVELTYIANDIKRKGTLKKRKKGLIKKIDELSTLCGVEACAIIYSPNDSNPEVWPSEAGVRSAIARFKTMPEIDKGKKMMSQETLLSQMIVKAQEQLKKLRNENRMKEMTHRMFQLMNGESNFVETASMTDLNDMSWLIDQNLKEIERKINSIQAQEGTSVVENGGETMNVGGQQQAHMDLVQMLQANMDDLINGVVGDKILPFGDVNIQNGLLPKPYVP